MPVRLVRVRERDLAEHGRGTRPSILHRLGIGAISLYQLAFLISAVGQTTWRKAATIPHFDLEPELHVLTRGALKEVSNRPMGPSPILVGGYIAQHMAN
jgi:hypothetical protein